MYDLQYVMVTAISEVSSEQHLMQSLSDSGIEPWFLDGGAEAGHLSTTALAQFFLQPLFRHLP